MSTTQFTSNASCKVWPDFNLNDYVVSLVDFIANNLDDLDEDFAIEFEDLSHEECVIKLGKYLQHIDSILYIDLDTDESNGNSIIFDWLVDQIQQDVMASKFMKIISTSVSWKYGVESDVSYLSKWGEYFDSDSVIKLLEENIPAVES